MRKRPQVNLDFQTRTVLVVDLRGSTEMQAQMQAEQGAEEGLTNYINAIETYYSTVAFEMYAWRGTNIHYCGDAVGALFADDEDAVRCQNAIKMAFGDRVHAAAVRGTVEIAHPDGPWGLPVSHAWHLAERETE